MTKGNQWAMKFEAVAGQLTNAQYANLAAFFNYVIEEEREAFERIARAELGPDYDDLFNREAEVVRRIVDKIRACDANLP